MKPSAEPAHAPPRVVIVGGGFGGLAVARGLRKAPVRVTLVDRRNHHLFQPLLYQVATAALNPSDIASPIRRVLRHQQNAQVLLGEVTAIDLGRKRLTLGGELPEEEIEYDILVLAAGATHSYFGNDEWAQFAPGLKTIEDALEIRRKMLLAFEAAEREPDPERRRAWMTFVIVGAGPTGVELAGTLTDVAKLTLARDFRRIDPREARVVLIEGASRVLPPYPERLSESARRQLERLGVEVMTGVQVTDVERDGVGFGTGRIAARTVIWAAGVAASPLGRALAVPLDRAGRVEVNADLTVPGHDDVFVIGDLARIDQDGQPVPGVAPAALQQGHHTARNIVRSLGGLPREPFRYHDKGSLATIGRGAGVANLGRIWLTGRPAWMFWLLVHILFLIGFRNRFVVMVEWAWSYFTHDRGARLITGLPGEDAGVVTASHPVAGEGG